MFKVVHVSLSAREVGFVIGHSHTVMVNKPSVFARKLRAVKGVGAGAQMYL